MSLPVIHIWKKAPFLRLLIPFVTGILLQWHLQIPIPLLWIFLSASTTLFFVFHFLPIFKRYRFAAVSGILITAIFIAIGGILSWSKNILHDENWFGRKYIARDSLVITLSENPVEKNKSYKANATIDLVGKNENESATKGNIIIYFQKDSSATLLHYGSRLSINKPLQEIKNSGNPGSFDYKRYSLFQGITHQVYLKKDEFTILESENKNLFTQFLNKTRQKIIEILRTYIPGEKEAALAEALLIGYKDDLDKKLVESYSNTGVVHVIAISGLHLGIIYWLLLTVTTFLKRKKQLRWLRPVSIITGLWLFSLLAGAQPSVVRSAVMFTCIILGEAFERKTSIYNTLALSAFILLCYNPYWLWDVGFQLSYAAVLSIVIFMLPIYNWFYIKNKILDFIWKLNAVTIAAQILTIPIGIYHFHQFPVSFLFTNFIAVPLSSLILIGEIFLCMISFFPGIALILGKIISLFIWQMNSYVERLEILPFSLWEGLQINIPQAILLLVIASGFGYWLIEKNKTGLTWGVNALFLFSALRSVSFIQAETRQQLIIYNVPQKQAIDFITGRGYSFIGDKELLSDDFVRNFHIKPSRIFHRTKAADKLLDFYQQENFICFSDKKILLLNETNDFIEPREDVSLDLLIISGNPNINFYQLTRTFTVKQVVFDGSCPARKINKWKKDCDSLNIPTHITSEKGAFVMRLN